MTGNHNSCRSTIQLQYGSPVTLESPNYPSNYNNNADCSWTVNAPAGETIFVEFITFSLESNYDYLHVGGNQYSGSTPPEDFRTPGNRLNLRFTSDGSSTRQGFQLRLVISLD